jgi:hypothetical protein
MHLGISFLTLQLLRFSQNSVLVGSFDKIWSE